MRLIAAFILTSLLLSACSNTGLRSLRSTSAGPDEFGIQPARPLEQPASFADLPPPIPGGGNRADRSALQEGVAAFGGRATDPRGPIPASDGALVRHTSRLGVTPGIRQQLGETDADFRRRQARLTQFRIVPVDRYNQAYRSQALDAQAEHARWQRAGARAPSAPPAN